MNEERTEVVEMDAIAVEEWDSEQYTPIQVEANQAALVKKSGLDDAWDAIGKDDVARAQAPKTTTNTMRRAGGVTAPPDKPVRTRATPTAAAAAPAATSTSTGAPPAKAAAPTFSPFGAAPALPSKPAAPSSGAKPTRAGAPASKPPAAPARAEPPPAKREVKPAAAPPPRAAPAVEAKPPRNGTTPAKQSPVTPAAADATRRAKQSPVTPVAADATTRAPSAFELPAWPAPAPAPAPAPGARAETSRAVTVEDPPRGDFDSPAFESWDDPAGATVAGSRAPTQLPRGYRADSVIVDLDVVSTQERPPARRPRSAPILTSEQSTTTSGAFVMPTPPSPSSPPSSSPWSEKPTSPAMPSIGPANPAADPNAIVAAHPPAWTSSQAARASTARHTPLPLAAPPPEPVPREPASAAPGSHHAPGSAPESPPSGPRPEPPGAPLARRGWLASAFPAASRGKKALLVSAGAIAVIAVMIGVGFSRSAADASGDATTDARPVSMVATAAAASTALPPPATSSRPRGPAAAGSSAAGSSPPEPGGETSAPPVGSPVGVVTAAPTRSPGPVAKKPVVAKRRLSRAKKPAVGPDKKVALALEPDDALTRARDQYAAGNRHLFAGEAAAAVASYREAVTSAPGYVAGYRGLGLAYAQQGDKASALAALRTYVKLAPTAKDIPLIEKRIASLSLR